MTSEELFKVLPVLEAMKEGKTIQFRLSERWAWEDVTEAHRIDINCYKYRVKPEAKYRPFEDSEECWSEMRKHQPFGWILDKEHGMMCTINGISLGPALVVVGSKFYEGYAAMLKKYTFADGTPFGIKEGGEELCGQTRS